METLASNQPFAQQVKRDVGEHCKSFVARAVKKTKPRSWQHKSGCWRNVGVKALHPCGVWSLPCGCLRGGQSMCRITDMKYGIAWKGLRIFPPSGREVIAYVAIFLVKSFEILIFVSEIPSISTASP